MPRRSKKVATTPATPPAPKPESVEKRRKREAAEKARAALDAMVAARPLSPPRDRDGKVIRPAVRCATAGELALARDRRLGLVGSPGGQFLDDIS
jgi:hypothetical protein